MSDPVLYSSPPGIAETVQSRFTLGVVDSALMLIYLLSMVWYGLKKAKRSNSAEYFLAGRDMPWPMVGISLFAANISSTTLVGLAGDAYSVGISVYNYEWSAGITLIFFSIFFLPFYLRSQVYTMPEFLERRYDVRSRYYFSLTTLVGNVLIETAAPLYIGSMIFGQVFPTVPSWIIIVLLALAAAAYTVPGGLSSVVHTEVIQAALLVLGSAVLTLYTLDAVGGWSQVTAAMEAGFRRGHLAVAPEEMLSLVRPIDDRGVPWTGLITGLPILSFYFWANNQFMVQRVLSAKDLDHGRWGSLFAGLLKLPVLFIMVLPGTMAIAMPEEIFPRLPTPDLVYPMLVFSLLPVALKGLVLAGLLAAMSSSISATLNSASTLITMDFVSKLRPGLSSKQLVRTGQVATIVLVALASLWAPQIQRFESLFRYLQEILAYIAPPVVAAFLVGTFWKRANGAGAISGFVVGAVFAVLRFTVGDRVFAALRDSWPRLILHNAEADVYYLHFLHVAFVLFVLCSLTIVVVSLLSSPPAEEKVSAYTWDGSLFTEESRALCGVAWYRNYRTLSLLLLVPTAWIVATYW